MKENDDNLDLIKVKYFFLCEGHCYENKKETIGWEKIFVEHMSDKGLLSKTQNSS